MRPTRLLVLVPTRNRAELAVAAVRSALTVASDRVRVLVSDNSTVAAQRSELQRALECLGDSRVSYMSPPAPLAMGAHWEWALEQGLDRTDSTHVTILTDRMLFVPGGVDDLLALSDDWPDHVVSYNIDRVQDVETPVRLEQVDWTGRVLEIPSAAMRDASAGCVFVSALPRLLNNVTPRAVLMDVTSRFGSVCDSVSPDFRFAYRALVVRPALVFYDRSLLLQYALQRSNGFSHSRGVRTDDAKDFDGELSRSEARFRTPLPDVRTVVNGIVHEYCSVRAEAPEASFAPLDVGAFFGAMTRELDAMEPGEIQTELRKEVALVMAREGAVAEPTSMAGGPRGLAQRLMRAASRAGRRDDAVGAIVRGLTGPVRDRYVPQVSEWPDVSAAIARARTHPRPARGGRSKHEVVLRDVRVLDRRVTPHSP